MEFQIEYIILPFRISDSISFEAESEEKARDLFKIALPEGEILSIESGASLNLKHESLDV